MVAMAAIGVLPKVFFRVLPSHGTGVQGQLQLESVWRGRGCKARVQYADM